MIAINMPNDLEDLIPLIELLVINTKKKKHTMHHFSYIASYTRHMHCSSYTLIELIVRALSLRVIFPGQISLAQRAPGRAV